jgi:HlyD family secretion protein
MKRVVLYVLIIPFIVCCGIRNNKSDAYGNFEAIEILVGSEAQGKVIQFNAEEGQKLSKGQVIGVIDTLPLFLKKQQLLASIEAACARFVQIQSQIDVQEEQKKTLVREQSRITKLVSSEAVPAKQLDDINGQLNILNSQVIATRSQNQSILGEIKALQFQVAQVQDQIVKSVIINPVNGTLLEKYIEQGEIAAPGKTLYKIADCSVLKLRVYVSGSQLPNFKLGQKVIVFVDKDKKENRSLEGTVTWISQQAEFTPKIIQTKEERVNLVYALKVDVVNDGTLKIGMPGEIKFELSNSK